MTKDNTEIEGIAKEYARQYYLVSEENHPEENATKALADLVEYHRHQLKKAREEEVRLFMTTLQDRANTTRPNLLLNEIVNYAHDRIKNLDRSELDQDTNKTS